MHRVKSPQQGVAMAEKMRECDGHVSHDNGYAKLRTVVLSGISSCSSYKQKIETATYR
jgi:hypothetical protein